MSSSLHLARSTFARQLQLAIGVLFVALSVGVLPHAQAQVPSAPDRQVEAPTEIVLLGTGHFAGSSTDEYSSSVRDVLSDRRQRELDSIASRIAEFAPDQFFVECTPDEQRQIDSLYRAYRAGDYDPTAAGHRNETRQLGFRAADRSGLPRLGCADAEGLWLGDQARAVARAHNPEVLQEYQSYMERMTGFDSAFLAEHTLGEWLTALNSDSLLFSNHNAYISYYARMGTFEDTGMKSRWEGDLDGQTCVFAGSFGGYPIERAAGILREMGAQVSDSITAETDYVILGQDSETASERARDVGAQTMGVKEAQQKIIQAAEVYVGFPDHHIGADIVGEWYKRNLRIYANIWQAAASDTDRIFVMFGHGHIWTLRQFFRENPLFEVVPVAEVL